MFDFKTICIYTEDALHPFFNKYGQVKLNLLSLYSKAELPSPLLNSKEVQICRLCLEITKDCIPLGTKMLQQEFQNVLNNHLPEILLDATNDPQICKNCRKQLYRFQEFVSFCTNTEEKVMKIFKEEIASGQLVESLESYSELHLMIKDELDFKRPPTICSLLDSCEYSTAKKVYKCSNCAYETTVRKYLKTHLLTHSHHDQGSYRCPKENCNWTSRYSHHLKRHIKGHTVITCRLCESQFDGRYEYVRHTKSQHREGKHWKCHQCENIYSTRSGLLIHMRTHKDDYLQCSECPFRTKYSVNLKGHKKLIHENGPKRIKKPSPLTYYCHDCSFETKTKATIRKHVLTHKSKSDVPLLECEECDFTAKTKDSLKKHQKIHLNIMYTCLVCDATYSSQSGLEKHKRLHSNKKKLKCLECDFESMDKYRLDAHLEKHKKITTGQKVHKCGSCSFQSIWKSCVSKHANRMHKKHKKKRISI